MVNYIINPMWFYWISVANTIRSIVTTFSILFGVASIVAIVATFVTFFETVGDDDKEAIEIKKAVKRFLVVSLTIFICFLLLSVFVPSKDTLIEMQVAKYATYENAEWTVDTIKSAVDYVVEAIKSLK